MSKALCPLGPIQDICRQKGWGGLATPEQEQRYQQALRKGCPGIRDYLRNEPPGSPLLPLAQRRWDTRMQKETRDELLVRGVTVVATSNLRHTRAEALAELTERTNAQAAEECGRYDRIPGYTLRSVGLQIGAADCESSGTGWTCSAESRAQCRIEWRREFAREQC